MEYLKRVRKNRRAACYELKGEWGDHLDRFIISTAPTRRICNVPDLVGCEFTRALEDGITLALQNFPPKARIASMGPGSVNVVHFLRAGLNFGIRNALSRAYGFNEHSSSFITSQRKRDEHGRWYICDDQYRKIELPMNSSLFIGEIVATGVTIRNALGIIFDRAKNLGRPISNLFFFTIACHKVEKILREFDMKFRAAFPGYEKTTIVYLEGKFHLADSKTAVQLKLQGTDLMRFPGILAPEFELSQYEDISYPLERCTIYDGGSRAFNVEEYLRDVRWYWGGLKRLSGEGLTLYDALKERWPQREYEQPFKAFAEAKKAVWKGIDTSFLKKLYQAHRKRWRPAFVRKAKTTEALRDLCEKRLAKLGFPGLPRT
ncbi:MAG: hypothetical protein P9M00_07100 [Candidatus Tritonobacter lacicola]|nr:hypothetical protein [Candidatus Tritonobacter lacicola]